MMYLACAFIGFCTGFWACSWIEERPDPASEFQAERRRGSDTSRSPK